MKIAVNTRLLLPGRLEGIGWFTYETIHRMARQHPEHEYHLIFDRPFAGELIPENCIPHVIFPPARHPLLFYIWFEFAVPRLLRKIKPDIFLSPDSFLSLRTSVTSVQVLHDINFEHERFGIPFDKYWYYKRFFHRFAKRADRIATVSEFSKKDISEVYHIDPSKIDVVYSGLNERYGPVDDDTQKQVRDRISGGRPYFLYVGSLHGRKNVGRLMQAYDLFRRESSRDIALVIAGEKMFRKDGLSDIFENLASRNDIIFTGGVSNEELRDILGSALSLVFVSLFEGFGLPILEAFQSGVPLICSNLTSMPEIAGDAAILVDPHSPKEIAGAMQRIATDESLRNELVRKGFERKGNYTWDTTAELLYHCILKAAGQD